ncbi:septum site-determining protein MinC [Xenophilus sp.]|uniref:septum site-determining protein MinC n=1 Tax=Xenophilus sp. TaxID=1873499 RepID=UPI0037DD65E8
MAPARMDYEPAGELKIGQVGIANLRVKTLDIERLAAEMRERVARAPKLFARAAVVLDFGGLSDTPDRATAQALVDALREAGVLPVALAYGTSANDALAQALGLPLLAKFRASYERAGGGESHPVGAAPVGAAEAATAHAPTSTRQAPAAPVAASAAPTREPAPVAPTGEPGLVQAAPVRSGQQLYAENRDLTVLSAVGAGAEVIADGSIHIYGPLRGRALAGAQGNVKARIFCRAFHAELVAVAGHYKVLDELPRELRGKPAQVWLEGDQLRVEAME